MSIKLRQPREKLLDTCQSQHAPTTNRLRWARPPGRREAAHAWSWAAPVVGCEPSWAAIWSWAASRPWAARRRGLRHASESRIPEPTPLTNTARTLSASVSVCQSALTSVARRPVRLSPLVRMPPQWTEPLDVASLSPRTTFALYPPRAMADRVVAANPPRIGHLRLLARDPAPSPRRKTRTAPIPPIPPLPPMPRRVHRRSHPHPPIMPHLPHPARAEFVRLAAIACDLATASSHPAASSHASLHDPAPACTPPRTRAAAPSSSSLSVSQESSFADLSLPDLPELATPSPTNIHPRTPTSVSIGTSMSSATYSSSTASSLLPSSTTSTPIKPSLRPRPRRIAFVDLVDGLDLSPCSTNSTEQSPRATRTKSFALPLTKPRASNRAETIAHLHQHAQSYVRDEHGRREQHDSPFFSSHSVHMRARADTLADSLDPDHHPPPSSRFSRRRFTEGPPRQKTWFSRPARGYDAFRRRLRSFRNILSSNDY